MKVVVRVGDVSVMAEGLDLTRRQIRSLLLTVAGIAASLGTEEPERTALGFAVITERADEPPQEDYFTDD